MHFIFPPWLRHGRPSDTTSIFSVDIQPNGQRVATCGQDCAVKIWHLPTIARLAALKDPTTSVASVSPEESNATSAKAPPPGVLLATLTSHTAAANVVRWAPRADMLASAGDDHVILIYTLAADGAPAAPAFGERAPSEPWHVRRPLRAHSSDVTDVAWSPDAERIASASVDNLIIVWSMRTESALVRLTGHTGLVKGLAWDPAGRFLASQSDDRTVRIWRTTDWKSEKVISAPFDSAVFQENTMTFFQRISWSPCGSYLITTNAYRKPGTHHAPMFSRKDGFENPLEFIGHREPVISSRFSPCMYRPHPKMPEALKGTNGSASDPSGKNKGVGDGTYTVLALGSKDGGCSVWRASGARPFCEMYDAFEMEVVDMAWGSDGYTFVACSTDSRVLFVTFEPAELGIVVPPDEARAIIADVWRSFGAGAAGADAPLPESAVQLRMEDAGTVARRDANANSKSVNGNDAGASRPVGDSSVVGTGKGKGTGGVQAATERGPITGIPAPVLAAAEEVRQKGPTPPADPKVMAAQAETRVRGGKRRITPVSMSTMNDASMGNAGPPVRGGAGVLGSGATGSGVQRSTPMPLEISESIPPPILPAKRPRTSLEGSGGDGELGRFARGAAAEAAEAARNDEGGALRGAGDGAGGANGAVVDGTLDGHANGLALREERRRLNVLPPGAKAVAHAAHLYAPSVAGLSMMLLPERGNEGPGRCRVIGTGGGGASIILESREQHGGGGGFVVTCSVGGKVKWRDYYGKTNAVTALAGVGGKYAAVGTGDGTLVMYSAASGRRLVPPICIDSAPYMLEAYWFGGDGSRAGVRRGGGGGDGDECWYVIVITRSAMCCVFDVRKKRIICSRSAVGLLARPAELEKGGEGGGGSGGRGRIVREVTHCEVTVMGEPVVMLSDGDVFCYSRDLCSWVRVADDALPNSEFRRTAGVSGGGGGGGVGIVRSLQSGRGGSGGKVVGVGGVVGGLSGMGDLRRAAVESLSHLESLMEAAVVMGCAVDYRYYLTNYVARVVAAVRDDVESCTLRLREVCDELLNAGEPTVDRMVLGMSGRTLLRETVLPVVAENRTMQRLVAEYHDNLAQIEALTSSTAADERAEAQRRP